jgi:sugar O-acyltransferase (sialic acid O-acetyltransferase NeuD family)
MNSPYSRSILIYGAGGHAKVVADLAHALGLGVAGYLEDGAARDGQAFLDAHVITWSRFAEEGANWPEAPVALAIGDNAVRARVYERLRRCGRQVITLVHPTAVVSPSAVLGEGTVLMPMAVVNAAAVLGVGVIVNSGAIVEHDSRVGDFVHLAPRSTLGGGARIGARALLGIGAVALPRAEIGEDARVGAGAVVLREAAPGATVVGVPARPTRPRPSSTAP